MWKTTKYMNYLPHNYSNLIVISSQNPGYIFMINTWKNKFIVQNILPNSNRIVFYKKLHPVYTYKKTQPYQRQDTISYCVNDIK